MTINENPDAQFMSHSDEKRSILECILLGLESVDILIRTLHERCDIDIDQSLEENSPLSKAALAIVLAKVSIMKELTGEDDMPYDYLRGYYEIMSMEDIPDTES